MLYERWRQIARARQNELALRDATTGQEWSFAQLLRGAEQNPSNPGPISFPHGSGPQFVFSVLEAWRLEKIVCPLELEQAPPLAASELPPGIAHLKMTSATTQDARLIAFTGPQL